MISHGYDVQRRFNVALFIYFVGALTAALLAWGDLKGDLRSFRTEFQIRMDNAERRLDRIDDAKTLPARPRRRG